MKKLILISALLFSFNGWAENDRLKKIQIPCEVTWDRFVSFIINPLLDKEVVGLIEAQVEMSHRIIKHTTTSVMHRIEWLRRHKDQDNLNNQNIAFQFSDPILSILTKFC